MAEEQRDILSAQVRGSLRAGHGIGRVDRSGRIRTEDCNFSPAIGVERITANGRCLDGVAQRRVEIAERINQIGADWNLNCRGKAVCGEIDIAVERFVSRCTGRGNTRQAACQNGIGSVAHRRGESNRGCDPIADVRKKTRGATRGRKKAQRVFMRPGSTGMIKEANELGARTGLQANTHGGSEPPVQTSTETFVLKSHAYCNMDRWNLSTHR